MTPIQELYGKYQDAYKALKHELLDHIYQHGIEGVVFKECCPYGVILDSEYYDRVLAIRMRDGFLEVRLACDPSEWLIASTCWSARVHVEIADLTEAILWEGGL